MMFLVSMCLILFFFMVPPTTQIITDRHPLSLRDALPISVETDRDGLAAKFGDKGLCRIDVDVGGNDASFFLDQPPDNRLADPACRASDDRDLVLQSAHAIPLPQLRRLATQSVT